MQLQRLPQALLRLPADLWRAPADSAKRHGPSSRLAATCAPMYPVEPVRNIATLLRSFRFLQFAVFTCSRASCKLRGGRASSGRPSISG